MRKAAVVFLASASIAAIAACDSSNNGGGGDGGGGEGGSGSSSSGSAVGGSGSASGSGGSGVVFDAGMAMQIGTPPTPLDGGVYCPVMITAGVATPTACASPEVCCWGDQSVFPAPLPGCTSATSCSGSVISCSNTAQCGAGQVCCFQFVADSGAMPGPGMGPFSAQCAAQCPTGDNVHYQLCAATSECPAGQTCTTMAPYSPYCMAGFPEGGIGLRDGSAADGAPPTDGGSLSDGAPAPMDASDAGAD